MISPSQLPSTSVVKEDIRTPRTNLRQNVFGATMYEELADSNWRSELVEDHEVRSNTSSKGAGLAAAVPASDLCVTLIPSRVDAPARGKHAESWAVGTEIPPFTIRHCDPNSKGLSSSGR